MWAAVKLLRPCFFGSFLVLCFPLVLILPVSWRSTNPCYNDTYLPPTYLPPTYLPLSSSGCTSSYDGASSLYQTRTPHPYRTPRTCVLVNPYPILLNKPLRTLPIFEYHIFFLSCWCFTAYPSFPFFCLFFFQLNIS